MTINLTKNKVLSFFEKKNLIIKKICELNNRVKYLVRKKNKNCDGRPEFVATTQNLFEVNLAIVGVEIQHDYKWGCDNPISILQPSKTL
jgi:hypothetical protein